MASLGRHHGLLRPGLFRHELLVAPDAIGIPTQVGGVALHPLMMNHILTELLVLSRLLHPLLIDLHL
jgi:hypothetical protein